MGGETRAEYLQGCEIYDDNLGIWQEFPSLPTFSSEIGSIVVGDRIVAFGAFAGTTFVFDGSKWDSLVQDQCRFVGTIVPVCGTYLRVQISREKYTCSVLKEELGYSVFREDDMWVEVHTGCPGISRTAISF